MATTVLLQWDFKMDKFSNLKLFLVIAQTKLHFLTLSRILKGTCPKTFSTSSRALNTMEQRQKLILHWENYRNSSLLLAMSFLLKNYWKERSTWTVIQWIYLQIHTTRQKEIGLVKLPLWILLFLVSMTRPFALLAIISWTALCSTLPTILTVAKRPPLFLMMKSRGCFLVKLTSIWKNLWIFILWIF